MRRIVITGPQPVDMLDLVGPLEVFKFAPEYEVAVASPEGTTELQLNHGFKISDAVPFTKLPAQIDTLVVAGGPGAIASGGGHLYRNVRARSRWTA
jgi:putative intracellular protease/amidase